MSHTGVRVAEIGAVDTYGLRRAVLRNADPAAPVAFAEDHWPGAAHLGAFIGERLVAVSTWVPRLAPDDGRDGVQLRGMATADEHRGTGIGGILVEAGCRRCAAAGTTLVWARARDTALAFYLRHRFVVHGDGFVDDTTGLPHHLVRRDLDRSGRAIDRAGRSIGPGDRSGRAIDRAGRLIGPGD